MTDNASNAPVSLEQVLTSKEQRARRQQAWLFQSDHTVVSVTVVDFLSVDKTLKTMPALVKVKLLRLQVRKNN